MTTIQDCPKCHAPVKRAGQRFCGKCGATLNEAVTEPPEAPDAAPVQPPVREPSVAPALPLVVSEPPAPQRAHRPASRYVGIALTCAVLAAGATFAVWWLGIRSTSSGSSATGGTPSSLKDWSKTAQALLTQSRSAEGNVRAVQANLINVDRSKVAADRAALTSDQTVRHRMIELISSWHATPTIALADANLLQAERLLLSADDQLLSAANQLAANSGNTLQYSNKEFAAERKIKQSHADTTKFERAVNAQLRASHIRPLLR
jgi:hypothetical protein